MQFPIATLVLPLVAPPQDAAPSAGYTIPIVDLAAETERQVVVDREAGQYLGHPTTVLLEDDRTMIAVYPKGHGRGAIVMKRSSDGGLTWSERLPTPASWATSKEVPTIHRLLDSEGTERLVMFSGLYPIRSAVSEDDGATWSELEPIGDYGGIVAMGCVIPLAGGRNVALFHDDGRFLRNSGERSAFHVYAVFSEDGGLTWDEPRVIAEHPTAHLCEPGFVRSPDGERIAVLLRENSRKLNSFVIFSDDEATTWTEPRQLPAALTGDRHTGRYAPDGRLFVTFRDTTRESPTQGDWVGWVGTWEDLVEGREGQYRVRLNGQPPPLGLRLPRPRAAPRRHLRDHHLRPLDRGGVALRRQRPLPDGGAGRAPGPPDGGRALRAPRFPRIPPTRAVRRHGSW